MGPARVVHLGVDACDVGLVETWAAAGLLPTFARFLEMSASYETRAPEGFFVSAIWPSIATARTPSTHRYTCWVEVVPGTYELRETTPREARGTQFWQVLSDRGLRSALLDVPHMHIDQPHNGILLAEWGCHDRHFGTASWPPSFRAEADERVGAHPVGGAPPDTERQFAPCDYLHRAGEHRTADELERLWNDVLEGHRRKAALSLEVLERGGWDLFMSVLGEAHCIGHQFWHVHDPTHPRHDPAVATQLGDPLLEMYRLLDATIAAHLTRLDSSTTVYLHLSHGMGPHYDGGHLLEHVLRRFEDGTSDDADLPPLAPEAVTGSEREHRRWFSAPNNTVTGAIRLNVKGREPLGVLTPGREVDEACAQLDEWLRELVNADTGEPLVTSVRRTDDVYARVDGDAFPDLLVEWNRAEPIERVASPRIGTIAVPYTHWRTGDHYDRGLLMARGPGINPGRRPSSATVVDIAPTLCAALGVELPDIDGAPIADLVPAGTRYNRPSLLRRWRADARELIRIRLLALLDVPALEQRMDRTDGELRLLARAHHETRLDATAARSTAQHAADLAAAAHASIASMMADPSTDRLTRLAAIHTTTQWVELATLTEAPLISVILPTHNRAALLPRAVRSVLDQHYTNWELLIVDDGSVDDTATVLESFDDPRIRCLSIEQTGCSGARNAALEVAKGEVAVYLDDDNLMMPLWLKAVAWAFEQRPDIDVVHGARLVDDVARVHDARAAGGLPWIQFEPYDRTRLEQSNTSDMGMLAHRIDLEEARFDEKLVSYGDWDVFLRLTEHKAPLDLPVIAIAYTTDNDDRLSRVSRDDDITRVHRKLATRRHKK